LYTRGPQETCALAVPFCKRQLQLRPTVIALASDNQQLFDMFKEQVSVLSAPVFRQNDADHYTGLTDMAMVMMCQEWLLSARSTFSGIVALRVARKFWMIEKYATAIYRVSSSQVAHYQTPLYYPERCSGSELSCMARLAVPESEEALRFYWKYLVV
jgi:hypothetical protein